MVYNLSIKQEAQQEILEGFLWYESKNRGLGTRFVAEVERVIEYVSKYPHHFQIKYKEYREALVPSFPYVVVFEVLEGEVVVYSVFPAKRDPNKKVR